MWWKIVIGLFALVVTGPVLVAFSGEVDFKSHWRTASREPAGIAPHPADHPEAIVLVYAARAYNWRGLFAVHTWIATKGKNEKHYVVHDVVGFRGWRQQPVLGVYKDIPDRLWYGNRPSLVTKLIGEQAETAIEKINAANESYPYKQRYRMWPGPNSNTYTAYIGRQVPELAMTLPPTAIGKDYLVNGDKFGKTDSGDGFQFSLSGLLGIALSKNTGVEINLFGAVFGLDVFRPALKLPGIGRVGMSRNHYADTSFNR